MVFGCPLGNPKTSGGTAPLGEPRDLRGSAPRVPSLLLPYAPEQFYRARCVHNNSPFM